MDVKFLTQKFAEFLPVLVLLGLNADRCPSLWSSQTQRVLLSLALSALQDRCMHEAAAAPCKSLSPLHCPLLLSSLPLLSLKMPLPYPDVKGFAI